MSKMATAGKRLSEFSYRFATLYERDFRDFDAFRDVICEIVADDRNDYPNNLQRKIAERIYAEGAPAVEDYFKFLSSGGSDSPVELLKLAGVDLTKKDAFEAAMASFKNALEQFEALM